MPPKSKPASHSSSTSAPSGGGHGKRKPVAKPSPPTSDRSRGVVVVNATPRQREAVRVIVPVTSEERRLFAPMFAREPLWGEFMRPWRRPHGSARRSDDGRRYAVDGLGQTSAPSTTPIAGLVAVGFIAAGLFWFASSKKTMAANRRRRMRRNRYWYYA